MPRKQRFPPEADTKPDHSPNGPETRRSGPAPKSKRDRAEAPTIPPPKISERASGRKASEGRNSGMRAKKREQSAHPAATVDEVTADMSKDPRREREGGDDDE
ncbi:MAG: hypothetical protein ACLP1X_22300 [Polyangiaceae bacterium]|jgi:hypothetical protein